MIEGPNNTVRTEEHDSKPERVKVGSCTSFDDLYVVLEEIGPVQGSQLYQPSDIRHRIEQVRHGHRDITFVTQTHGIREKVRELLDSDPIFKKYSSPKYNKQSRY